MAFKDDWDDLAPTEDSLIHPASVFDATAEQTRAFAQTALDVSFQNYLKREENLTEEQAYRISQYVLKTYDQGWKAQVKDIDAYRIIEYALHAFRLAPWTLQDFIQNIPDVMLKHIVSKGHNTGIGGVLAVELLRRTETTVTYRITDVDTVIVNDTQGENATSTEFNLYESLKDDDYLCNGLGGHLSSET